MNRARIDPKSVIEMYATGISCKETAKALGICERHCFRILSAANASRNCRTARRMMLPGIEERWKEVERLYLLGNSSAQVSEQVDYSPRDVRRICRKLGISRSKREAACLRLKDKELSPDGYARQRIDDKEPLVHRLIAENILGRKLKKGEEVHHRNENRRDNRPENLEVMSKSAHIRLHNYKRWHG